MTRRNSALDYRQLGWARSTPAAFLLPVSLATCLSARPVVAAHARPAAGSLRPVRLPDGSGTIALPAGWRIIEGYQGRVRAEGPEGLVSLGFSTPIGPPSPVTQRGQLSARYGTPVQVAQQLAPQFGVRGYQPTAQVSRPWGIGKQSVIDWRAEVPGKGRMEGRSVIMVRRMNEGGRATAPASRARGRWLAAPAVSPLAALPCSGHPR